MLFLPFLFHFIGFSFLSLLSFLSILPLRSYLSHFILHLQFTFFYFSPRLSYTVHFASILSFISTPSMHVSLRAGLLLLLLLLFLLLPPSKASLDPAVSSSPSHSYVIQVVLGISTCALRENLPSHSGTAVCVYVCVCVCPPRLSYELKLQVRAVSSMQ